MKKRLLSAFTAAVTAAASSLSVFPVVLTARTDSITGGTEDGFTYEITDTSVKITGWTGDKETVTSLVIPGSVEGAAVTLIDSGAFDGFINLTDVSIPDTVTGFGWSVFAHTAISSIDLPPGITSLGILTFDDCKNLKEITIPAGAPKNIIQTGNYYGSGLLTSFTNCSIETIILEDGIEFVPDCLCLKTTTVKNVVIPDSVKSIGNSAFSGCSGITSVDISDNITEIGDYAFYGCNGIKDIYLPDSVDTIRSVAFAASTIESVRLPEDITSIGGGAFEDCLNLKEITIPASVSSAPFLIKNSGVETITFGDGMERLPDQICDTAVNLKTVNIPRSVTNLGTNTFISAGSLTDFTIPAQITEGKRSFIYSGLENISFEEGIEKVPDELFDGAFSLKNINWADSVTEIGFNSFGRCNALEKLDFPPTIKVIGHSGFGGCAGLKELYLPDTLEMVCDSAFVNCDALETVRLPENGCAFGDSVFAGNGSLRSVYIPDGLHNGNGDPAVNMFRDCYGLESITFADTIKVIPNGTANNCKSLKEIHFPAALETIGSASFADCTSLQHIELPETLTCISDSSFAGCTMLSDVKLPDSIETIGYGAFNRTYSLRSITIPASLKNTGLSFQESGIKEAWLEEGFESVPDYIFVKCEKLETVHLPDSVKSIGGASFAQCYSLRNLDMPFKKGELLPMSNFYDSFKDCWSLDDERVNIYDSGSTFVNRTEVSQGEDGILNYTVYCLPNPVHSAKKYSGGRVSVHVDGSNPILTESLPVGLRPDEYAGLTMTDVSFEFSDEDTGMQVFRFSTRPKPDADTEVFVYYSLCYDGTYLDMRIPVKNSRVSFGKLSLSAPEYANVKDGTASFDLKGSFYGDGDVTIYINDTEAAAVTPNAYSGKYFCHMEIPAEAGDKLSIYASAENGEKSAVYNTVCQEKKCELEKIIFKHDNSHTSYSLDITDAVKNGITPYVAYNPSNPIGFEVTLSDNNCLAVFVTSTLSGNSSSIELFFDEESGTWKGEGYFKSHIPGVLDVYAIRDDYEYTMELNTGKDGSEPSLKLAGTDLLAETPAGVPDLARDFINEADISVIAGNENCAYLRFKYDVEGEECDTGWYAGRSEELYLEGEMISAAAIAEDPDKYGFVKSPLRAVDENGDLHTYYFKFVVDEDVLKDLAENTFIEEEEPPLSPAPGFTGTVNRKTSSKSLIEYVYENQDDSASIVNGSYAVEKIQEKVTGGTKYDALTTVVVEGSKEGINYYLSTKDLGIVGDVAGDAMTLAEVGVRTVGWVGEMKAINESKDPYVQESKYFMMGCSTCIFTARVGSIVLGGAMVSSAITATAAGIAAGAAVLPTVIAGAAVIGGVVLFNKALNAVHDWFKPQFAGEARMTGNGFELKYLIDPSGIAYEFLPSNPVEGAKAEIYYKDADGNAVLWNAEDYDQVNPQITDSAGWFAWDVPEGEWQVRVSKKGYDDAESEWLPVLPVQTGVDLDMRSTLAPEIAEASYFNGTATVRFTKHMLDGSVTSDSLFLTDADGNRINAAIKPVKESVNNTDYSIVYRLKADTDQLSGVSVNVTADAKSYAGTAAVKASVVLEEGTGTDEPDVMLGDVNFDGNVDASDASSILEEYANLSTGAASNFTEEQNAAGDVNSDGNVDASDASLVLGYYSFLSTGGTGTLEEYLKAA